MMLKISDWMRVLREQLHIASIEADVIAIDDALKSVDINIAKGQALLANEQKRLEVILAGIENTANKLILAIGDERRHREETRIQLMAEIAAMKNEMKRVADIVDQQIQPTHHDSHK